MSSNGAKLKFWRTAVSYSIILHGLFFFVFRINFRSDEGRPQPIFIYWGDFLTQQDVAMMERPTQSTVVAKDVPGIRLEDEWSKAESVRSFTAVIKPYSSVDLLPSRKQNFTPGPGNSGWVDLEKWPGRSKVAGTTWNDFGVDPDFVPYEPLRLPE